MLTTQGCRTPDRCRATIHVCDPEPGSDAWFAEELGYACMSAAPTVDDLAEDFAWIVGLIRLFLDRRRFRGDAVTTQALVAARRRLIAAISGAA
jgi:hypothetical protein